MNLESKILVVASVMSIISLLFIPKNKSLEAQFIILFIQLLTWIFGLTVVELGLLEYPYREIASANRTSFLFEFLILPILCVHFYNYYPKRAAVITKIAYFVGISLLLTGFEVILERCTMLIKYTGWKWYWSWISLMFVFWLNKKTVRWFFRPIK